ncbi:MAG TPA: metalloregulator ArsR/SmtB family transcription factor [Usitatibacteraceae bacterium]|nr:metalloregulator ArsR/SmtB family transcription factor [Usitatibacteraceae bacterium]
METKTATAVLGALAQETRLAIFRLLVVAGSDGLAVGTIAARLGIANATLSFHLKELTQAGLTIATPQGRSIVYAANFDTMNSILQFLTENCCAGSACGPGVAACAPRLPVRKGSKVPAKPPTSRKKS